MSELDMPAQVKAATQLFNEALGLLPKDQARALSRDNWRKWSNPQARHQPLNSEDFMQDAQKASTLVEGAKLALDSLTEREKRVFGYQVGFEDGNPHTIAEAATRFGVTDARIGQIMKLALQKTRHPSRAKHIYPLLTPK